MGDIIRNFENKKEIASKVHLTIEESMGKSSKRVQRKASENGENIINNAPFRYRMDLDAIAPLSPEDEELLKFLTEEPPADENVLQRNYRINRLNEFDNLVKELIKPKNKK